MVGFPAGARDFSLLWNIHCIQYGWHVLALKRGCGNTTALDARQWIQRLRWSRGSVLAFGTQVRGFKPGRSRQIFKGQIKIFSMPSFGGEVKPSVPCRRFAACKRSLNVTWNSTFRQNYRPWFLPTQFHLSLLGGSLGLHGRGGRTSNESGDVKNTWIIRE